MKFLSLAIIAVLFYHNSLMAHSHHDKGDQKHGVQGVRLVKVADNITMIQAGGGNIGVLEGEDSLFVIDSDYKKSAKKVRDAVFMISQKPVKLLLNTHWHFDHVGSNAEFGKYSVIIAHENVRKRMKQGGHNKHFDVKVEPASRVELPVLTFKSKTMLHLAGEDISVIPVNMAAHTDGDSFVYWSDSNVIHTGDLFFNGFWPYIDIASGGSIDGMIKATDKILALADDKTKIIPGHGPLGNKADLKKFNAMLKQVSARVKSAKNSGKTLQEFQASAPLADLDKEWGDGFLSTQKFIETIY